MLFRSQAKREIIQEEAAVRDAAAARERFRARNARLARAADDSTPRHAVPEQSPDDKQAVIAAAVARSKARRAQLKNTNNAPEKK